LAEDVWKEVGRKELATPPSSQTARMHGMALGTYENEFNDMTRNILIPLLN
jgi:hypothetical protein